MTTTVAITWILLLLSAASCTAAAFHHQQRQRSSSWTSRRGRRIALDYDSAQPSRRSLLVDAAAEEIDDSGTSSSYNTHPSSSSAATASSFDFASALAWETHYSSASSTSSTAESTRRRRRAPSSDDAAAKDRGGDSKDCPVAMTAEGIVNEWHQQIPLERIAEIVVRLLLMMIRGADAKDKKNALPTILVVGCGTSRLPSVLMDQLSIPVHMVLLDASRSCMEQVHQRYCGSGTSTVTSDKNHLVECVCGNVLKPPSTWQRITSDAIREGSTSSDVIPIRFDMVIDKGLMDVLLCGDDWDSTVPQLLKMADDSFSAHGDGDGHVKYYVLVSYTLPTSTRQFLVEQLEDWDWNFDVDGGPNRGRSMISIGRKRVF